MFRQSQFHASAEQRPGRLTARMALKLLVAEKIVKPASPNPRIVNELSLVDALCAWSAIGRRAGSARLSATVATTDAKPRLTS